MHCADPECLTGCPTGAIFRDAHGDIDIDASTCIGCFDCATQCPYDAISMVPRASPAAPSGFVTTLKRAFSFKIDRPAPPETSDDPVAIKCNLCEGTSLNPAGAKRKAYSCEENCPTGALVRVDPTQLQSSQEAQFAAAQASMSDIQSARQAVESAQQSLVVAEASVSSARQQLVALQTAVDRAQEHLQHPRNQPLDRASGI